MGFNNSDRLIRGIAFEKAIISILRERNKNLLTDYAIKNKNKVFICDGYCKKILDLSSFNLGTIESEKICIEIKAGRPDISKLIHFIEVISQEINVLVLIFSGETPKKLVNYLQRHELRKKVMIIDKNKLMRNDIIRKVLNSFEKYIIQENNVLIDDNYKTLENSKCNLSFALGAGCSIKSNISDWSRLSEALGFELLYNIVDSKDSTYKNMIITNQLNKKIFDCYEKSSALDAIYNCYMKSATVNKLDYFKAIKNVLYMSYNSPNDANNPLIESIKECILRRNIKEIINYNFDSVLEQNFNNKYKSNSKEVNEAKTKINECEIHHVHGYIPYDYDGKTIVNSFVFTDKEYYDNMMDINNESNSIQMKILRNYNVIFVGVSFTDTNLKALLRKRLDEHHTNDIFGFLKLPSFEGNENERKLLENKYKLIQQSYFDSLGVKILWVNDFDEIPKEIDKI